jgi:class 3 adenylate cyclase
MGADEAGTMARLERVKAQTLVPLIAQYHGRVVKLMGDGFLVEFASVVDALTCALAWQEAVEARADQLSEEQALRFRIGVNLGDIMVKADDLYGDGVNVAARLEGLAEPGSVLVSRTVFDHAKGKVAATFHEGRIGAGTSSGHRRLNRGSGRDGQRCDLADQTLGAA